MHKYDCEEDCTKTIFVKNKCCKREIIRGPPGPKGKDGPKGEDGDQGNIGPIGSNGPPGQNGKNFDENLQIGNTIFVDKEFGNDLTGQAEKPAFPYSSCVKAAEKAEEILNNNSEIESILIKVNPGTYIETQNLFKNNVHWFFFEGAVIEAEETTLFFIGGDESVNSRIRGSGEFNGKNNIVINIDNTNNSIKFSFQAKKVTSEGFSTIDINAPNDNNIKIEVFEIISNTYILPQLPNLAVDSATLVIKGSSGAVINAARIEGTNIPAIIIGNQFFDNKIIAHINANFVESLNLGTAIYLLNNCDSYLNIIEICARADGNNATIVAENNSRITAHITNLTKNFYNNLSAGLMTIKRRAEVIAEINNISYKEGEVGSSNGNLFDIQESGVANLVIQNISGPNGVGFIAFRQLNDSDVVAVISQATFIGRFYHVNGNNTLRANFEIENLVFSGHTAVKIESLNEGEIFMKILELSAEISSSEVESGSVIHHDGSGELTLIGQDWDVSGNEKCYAIKHHGSGVLNLSIDELLCENHCFGILVDYNGKIDTNLYFKELICSKTVLELKNHGNLPLTKEQKKQNYFKILLDSYEANESQKDSKIEEKTVMIKPVFEEIDFDKINLDEALGYTTKSNVYLQSDKINCNSSIVVVDKNNNIAGSIFVAVKDIVIDSESNILTFDFENNGSGLMELNFAIDHINYINSSCDTLYLSTTSTFQGRMDVIDNSATIIKAINPNDICIKSIEWNCQKAVESEGGTFITENETVPHDFCLQLQKLNGLGDIGTLISIKPIEEITCRFICTISEINCSYNIVYLKSKYDIWLRFIKAVANAIIIDIENDDAGDSQNYRFEGHFTVNQDDPCIKIDEPNYGQELGLTLKDTTLISSGQTIQSINDYRARFQNVFCNNNIGSIIADVIGTGLFVNSNVK